MISHSGVRTVSVLVSVMLTGLILAALATSARAQTSFGALVGTVTDNSGAVIPGADVTVINTATGVARRMETDRLGDYRAVSLVPGPYKVSAAHTGFAVAQSDTVSVVVGATITVDLIMPVGSSTQTVQVVAETPLLDTEDSTLGTLVNRADIANLPLDGRAYTDLIQLMPGSFATGSAGPPGHTYSLNGVTNEGTIYDLDGIYTNEQSDNKYSLQPSPDALEEFSAQTNITSARYGGGEGGVVNVVTKSGTNQLHGAGWEFVRNTDFNANNYFANYANNPRPPYHQNQYGFVLDGPVMIPGHYDGRDKTFWMFNWEDYKERQGAVAFATVPTQAELGGDFRGLNPIYNPYLTVQTGVNAQGQPVYSATQFSCNGQLNVICPNLISPAAQAYAAALVPSVTKGGANNYENTQEGSINMYQLTARVDQNIGSKLNAFARYSRETSAELYASSMPSQDFTQQFMTDSPEVSLTYTANPTTVLDFKLGVHRNLQPGGNLASSGPAAAAFLTKYPAQGIAERGALPLFYEDNWSGYTFTNSLAAHQTVTVWNPIVNLTKSVGRHSMDIGYTMWRNQDNNDVITIANFSFDNVPTSDPNNVARTGDSIASFLLGLPTAGTREDGNTEANYRWTNYAGYFQDAIKVARKLTINAGLRYEYNEWPSNPHGYLGWFDPDSLEYVWAGPNPATGQGPNAEWSSLIKPYALGWAPRLGLAYLVNHNTTFSSGFGVFHGGSLLNMTQNERGQWPYAISQGFSGTNVITPNDPLATYFPAYTSIQLGTPPTALQVTGHNQSFPYTMEWNADVQHEFAANMLLDVNYVGNHAKRLPMYFIGNAPEPGPGTIGSPQHPRPINNIPGVGPLIQQGDYGDSNYEALQVKFQKRLSSGLDLLAYYVYANQWDLEGSAWNDSGSGTSFAQSSAPQDPDNWRADWGHGTYDVRHSFKAAYVYQLPFGSGQRWLGNSKSVIDAIVGGWNVSGITTYRTGAPVNIVLAFDNANTGTTQRPNYIPGFPARVISPTDKTHGWLNPASYAVPSQYTFGNLPRNFARAPGLENWDFSAYKNFTIREGGRYLQFRADSFNLLNHTNFNAPGNVLGTSNFGVISGAADPRFVQLALKFVF